MHDMPFRRPRPSAFQRRATRGPEKTTDKESDAFEIWLRECLRQAFDDVAAEPVPDDLLRLIEEDRAERERLRRRRKGESEA